MMMTLGGNAGKFDGDDDGDEKFFEIFRTHLLVPCVGNVGPVEYAECNLAWWGEDGDGCCDEVDYDGGDGGLLMVWVRSTLKTAYHDASSDPVYTQ